jgi:hypothetical protein
MEDVVEAIKGPRTARFPAALWACSKRLYRLRPLKFLPAGPQGLIDLTGVVVNDLRVVIVPTALAIAAHTVIPENLADVTFYMSFDILETMDALRIAWPRGMNSVRVTVWNGGMRPEVVRIARAMFRDRDIKPIVTFRAAAVAARFEDDEQDGDDVWAQLRDAIGSD